MKTELEDSKKLQLSIGEVMKMREVSGVQLERECYYNVQVCHIGQSGISGGIAIVSRMGIPNHLRHNHLQSLICSGVLLDTAIWDCKNYCYWGTAIWDCQKKQAWRQDVDVEYML